MWIHSSWIDGYEKAPPPIHRVLRLVGWNVLLLVAGLALVLSVAEVWLRTTTPFVGQHFPIRFVPNVGILGKPNTEVRWTNGLEFWTVSRTNSLGFLDREPINPERAATSCHIAMIGDSFVEAPEVAIADKFHVRLEALAAQELPHLDVTTSAFGKRNSGQINQLPYYDEFARHLRPKVVVLVFFFNDFDNNSPILTALKMNWHPNFPPYTMATKDENGTIRMVPPSPDFRRFRLVHKPDYMRFRWLRKGTNRLIQESYFLFRLRSLTSGWMRERITRIVFGGPLFLDRVQIAMGKLRSYSPLYARLFDRWERSVPSETTNPLPYFFEGASEYMAFALDQFKDRAAHDGASLVILSSLLGNVEKDVLFGRMTALAEVRGIPIIDYWDYVVRQGADPAEGRFKHDNHWNPTGHQWAAEALLEYLTLHQELCHGAVTEEMP